MSVPGSTDFRIEMTEPESSPRTSVNFHHDEEMPWNDDLADKLRSFPKTALEALMDSECSKAKGLAFVLDHWQKNLSNRLSIQTCSKVFAIIFHAVRSERNIEDLQPSVGKFFASHFKAALELDQRPNLGEYKGLSTAINAVLRLVPQPKFFPALVQSLIDVVPSVPVGFLGIICADIHEKPAEDDLVRLISLVQSKLRESLQLSPTLQEFPGGIFGLLNAMEVLVPHWTLGRKATLIQAIELVRRSPNINGMNLIEHISQCPQLRDRLPGWFFQEMGAAIQFRGHNWQHLGAGNPLDGFPTIHGGGGCQHPYIDGNQQEFLSSPPLMDQHHGSYHDAVRSSPEGLLQQEFIRSVFSGFWPEHWNFGKSYGRGFDGPASADTSSGVNEEPEENLHKDRPETPDEDWEIEDSHDSVDDSPDWGDWKTTGVMDDKPAGGTREDGPSCVTGCELNTEGFQKYGCKEAASEGPLPGHEARVETRKGDSPGGDPGKVPTTDCEDRRQSVNPDVAAGEDLTLPRGIVNDEDHPKVEPQKASAAEIHQAGEKRSLAPADDKTVENKLHKKPKLNSGKLDPIIFSCKKPSNSVLKFRPVQGEKEHEMIWKVATDQELAEAHGDNEVMSITLEEADQHVEH